MRGFPKLYETVLDYLNCLNIPILAEIAKKDLINLLRLNNWSSHVLIDLIAKATNAGYPIYNVVYVGDSLTVGYMARASYPNQINKNYAHVLTNAGVSEHLCAKIDPKCPDAS